MWYLLAFIVLMGTVFVIGVVLVMVIFPFLFAVERKVLDHYFFPQTSRAKMKQRKSHMNESKNESEKLSDVPPEAIPDEPADPKEKKR